MFNPRLTLLALGFASMVFCTAPAAYAEDQPPAAPQTQVPPQIAPATQTFTQEQINSYARSAVKINDLLISMEAEIKAADTPEKKQTLSQTLQTKMMDIVAKDGSISVDEYNAISTQVRADENLAHLVVAAIKKEKGIE